MTKVAPVTGYRARCRAAPTSARKAVELLQGHGAYDAHSGRGRRGPYAPNIRTEQPSPFFDLTYPEDLAQAADEQPASCPAEGADSSSQQP